MEYKTITTSFNTASIDDEVNKAIKEGWEPLGGVSSASLGNKFFIIQAMTRPNKPDKTTRKKALISPTEVINSYNKYFAKENVTRKLKPTTALETRLRTCIYKEFKDISAWYSYFELIEMSDFLMGKIPPTGKYKQFKLDLEFIINETNIAKILEGKFNNER